MTLSLQARLPQVTEQLLAALNEPGEALAPAALAIARVEYPALDPAPYLQRLERMGEAADGRLQRQDSRDTAAQIATLNGYLFEELGFSGNREHYDDPRNSFLNEVLDRRLGIPISLAVVYLEIGRRAGLRLEGVNFRGTFSFASAPTRTRSSIRFTRVRSSRKWIAASCCASTSGRKPRSIAACSPPPRASTSSCGCS